MTSAPSAEKQIAPTSSVHLDNVSVRYQSGTIALDGISLRINRGERVGLVGSSGAGKSSLISLLNGRVVFDGATVTGIVEVLGVEPKTLNSRALRRHGSRIGTVRQAFDLVGPMKVIHNVNAGRLGNWSTSRSLWSLWRPGERESAAAALEQVGLDRSVLEANVDELSGGQQQRVAVARLLVQSPELVLADEPVSSLDPALSEQILEVLAKRARDQAGTLVVSLHQPELASRFLDRVIGLSGGQVVFDRPADAVNDGELEALYRQ